MRRTLLVVMMMFALIVAWGTQQACAGSRIGGGANYWVSIDDVDEDDIDENGLSYFVSYQVRPSFIGLDLQVEVLPDFYGEDAYAPQAYVVVGGTLYAAAGIGIVNFDGDWAKEPFYALKAGFDLELVPGLYVDIFGNYRFSSEEEFDDAVDEIDTDSVFLGAAIRIGSSD